MRGVVFVLLTMILPISTRSAICQPCPEFERTIGINSGLGRGGAGPGEFQGPKEIAFDSFGNYYVTDYANNRVQKFSPGDDYILEWGSFGTGDGQFKNPWGIVVDASNNVYVVDRLGYRIQKFDSSGNFIRKWGSGVECRVGRDGDCLGEFFIPGRITVSPEGNIYVTDDGNQRIQVFTSEGVFVSTWGPIDGSPDIEFGPDGNLYLADGMNDRVQIYLPNGQLIMEWGVSGSETGQLSVPYGLDLDTDGNVYVTSYEYFKVQLFSASGSFLCRLAGEFVEPGDVSVAPNGSIYISETILHQLQKYTFLAIPTESISWGRIKSLYTEGAAR